MPNGTSYRVLVPLPLLWVFYRRHATLDHSRDCSAHLFSSSYEPTRPIPILFFAASLLLFCSASLLFSLNNSTSPIHHGDCTTVTPPVTSHLVLLFHPSVVHFTTANIALPPAYPKSPGARLPDLTIPFAFLPVLGFCATTTITTTTNPSHPAISTNK